MYLIFLKIPSVNTKNLSKKIKKFDLYHTLNYSSELYCGG